MTMALALVTPPAAEPISLAEAKRHLEEEQTHNDVLITALITKARQIAEAKQGRALLTQTYDLWLDAWPDKDYIALPMSPLQSVTYVKYYDTADNEYEFAVTDYFVDDKSLRGRVHLGYSKTWPSLTLRPINGIVVRFVVGYAAYSGTVSTAGVAVTRVSGDLFNTAWTAGTVIVINKVPYVVASVTSGSALTLEATAGTQSGVVYKANDVPQTTRQAMLMLIAHFYENREAVLVGSISRRMDFVDILFGADEVVRV